MLEKDVPSKEGNQQSRSMVIGGIVGGIIGFAIAYLYEIGISTMPGLGSILTVFPINPIITAIVLGIIIGAAIGGLFTLNNSKNKAYQFDLHVDDTVTSDKVINDTDGVIKMQLREEKMDISKEQIQTGEVNIHKETLTEEKNITIPVTREELVIEKKVPDTESYNKSETRTETIRIPLSEERVDIQKHKVKLEDVSVQRHQFEKEKHITETLKKEVAHVNTKGNAKIVNKRINSKGKVH